MDKDALEKIINRIKEHKDYYNQNEMAVRNQIINPVLRVFGWDPEIADHPHRPPAIALH